MTVTCNKMLEQVNVWSTVWPYVNSVKFLYSKIHRYISYLYSTCWNVHAIGFSMTREFMELKRYSLKNDNHFFKFPLKIERQDKNAGL